MVGMVEKFPVTVNPAASVPLNTQLKEQIKWLIALGDLKPGNRLPTVNELADRLRINRNTVAQVYAELAQDGYLIGRHRQGTFVAEGEAVRRAVQNAALGRLVDEALKQALAAGFTPAQFAEAAAARSHIQAALAHRYTALFVECNWTEIETYGHTVQAETGVAVTSFHLDEVRKDPAEFQRRSQEVDLVITTLFHLEEVQAVLGQDADVVGLGAGPELQLLRSLVQLPRGTTVAICCLDRDKATQVRASVANTGVQHLDMLAIGIDERDRLRAALAQTDYVFVSNLAYPEACRIVDPAKLRTYELRLDRASIEMLKARLADWHGRQKP